jgi:TRAP-type mannitol/chloroaromatic compound transport system permease small subunit
VADSLNASGATPEFRLRTWIVRIERIVTWSGKLCAWLIVPMIGALVYEVFSRYGFDRPTMWAYDMTFMLYGSHFMLGAAYTLSKGAHIRTDFLYRLWSDRVQAIVDLSIYLIFFFPGFFFFLWVSIEFAAKSWEQGELITTSPWLPIVYPFKTVIPVTIALLMIQGVAESLKCVEAIKQGRWT